MPIQFKELPVSKTFELGNEIYEFRFYHNKRFDFISFEVWQEDKFLFSNKICYGNNIVKFLNHIPFAIVPLTENDLYILEHSSILVNSETLGVIVNLYFEDGL